MPETNFYGGGVSLRVVRSDMRNWLRVKRLPSTLKSLIADTVGAETFEQSLRHAPYEFGNLVTSGQFRKTREGFSIRFLAGYAAIQHENLEFNHPGTHSRSPNMARAAQGRAKYVDAPFQDARRAFMTKAKQFGLI